MIVEKIFGKDINSIDKKDLDNIINIPESRSIEFKTILDIDVSLKPWQQKKEVINNKENILKSIVGFLNVNDNGLLILGVSTEDEVAVKVSGIHKDTLKQLKTEISLEDFIKEKVKSIPSYLNEFKLETKIVEYTTDRIVVFIEVLNKNWEHVYYSDITQYVYIRKGKSTKQMHLQDTLKLIAERNYPQIHVSFDEIKGHNHHLKENKDLLYKVNLINKGVKTAEKAHSFILIGSDDSIDIKPTDGYSAYIEDLDSKNHGLNEFIQNYRNIIAYQFVFPKLRKSLLNIDRIYPFNRYPIGHLAINKNDIEKIKRILILTAEDSGFVKQEFKVSIDKNKVCFEEIKSNFNPYITI
ncbi:MAG: hypothetical protein Kow0019_11770 [Methanobacteriaceae archaeon]